MKRITEELRDFFDKNRALDSEERLSAEARKFYRSLKSEGVRSTRCRDIDRYIFESFVDEDGAVLKLILEGRDSKSVSKQVGKKFAEQGLDSNIVETKRGAKLIIRVGNRGSDNDNN